MAEKIITFTNYSGTYKGEFVPHYNSTFQTVNGVIFSSVGSDTLYIYILYNKQSVVAAAGLATAGTTTRSLNTALIVNKIVPGSIVFTDSQGVTWTDDGFGTMTPSGTGGTADGTSGTIDYLGGQVALTYDSNPGAITLSHDGYEDYRAAKWASTPSSTDPSIVILNEPITLMTGEQSLLFTSTVSTASAYVKYTS